MPSGSISNSAGVPKPGSAAQVAIQQLKDQAAALKAAEPKQEALPVEPGQKLRAIVKKAQETSQETGSALPVGVNPLEDVSTK